MTRAGLGFAVAGGRSLRMGQDKALLPWGETTLLNHTLARLREVTREVRILCGPEPRYVESGVSVVLDAVPDAGPLAGVLAGLRLLQAEPGVFLGLDLPFVPAPLLARLLELAQGADAVVPVTASGPHPLCAAYGAGCRAAVERHLQAGERRMTCFWPDVRVREVGEAELAAFGDPEDLLRNLNTPGDYAEARIRAR